MKFYKFLILGCVLFFGCAHAPSTYRFDSVISYENDYDVVWSSIISIFAKKNIPIKTIEKDSGIIVTENMSIRIEEFSYGNVSKYCDCGDPGFPYYYKNFLGSFNVFARKVQQKEVIVQVNGYFRASKYQGNNLVDSVVCESTGVLEKGFFRDLNNILNNYPMKNIR